MAIPPGGGLLIYTDGLPDSIAGNSQEVNLYRALDNDLARTMSNLKALVDPRFNEDDIAVLLVKRTAASGVRVPSGAGQGGIRSSRPSSYRRPKSFEPDRPPERSQLIRFL
jgi:hypothetical protein